MGKIIILDTIVGIIILSRIKAPWWAYFLLFGCNILFYTIGDNRGCFDENKVDKPSTENDENNKKKGFPTEALFAGIITVVCTFFVYLLYTRALPDLDETWQVVWTWSGIIMLSLLVILFLYIFWNNNRLFSRDS